FPRFVQIARNPAAARRWLIVTVGAVVGLSVVGLPFLVLLRHWAISLAFGGRFAPAAQFVPGLSIAMMFLAVANLLVYFHIAAGTRSHLVLFGGAAAEAVLIAIFHHSAGEVVGVVVAVSAVVTAMLAHAAIVATRSARVAAPLRSVSGPPGRVRVSLVLPCHNAGPGLTGVLETALAELDEIGAHQVVVVSDGSTDETVRIANTFADRGVQVIEYADCAGKGHALRVGLSAASGDYVAFMDADGDISPEALRPFLTLMDLYQPDIILGSKRHPLSEIEYPLVRRVLSWTYHKLTRVLFRVNVRDTQTGMKLVRREVLLDVLPLMREEGYAFDLEMLVVAKQLGFVRVFEAPIRIDYGFTSQMNLRTPIRIMSQTLAIFYRRYLLNTYAQPVIGSSAPAPIADVIELPVSRVIPAHDEDGRLRVLFLNWRDIANPEAGGAEVFTHEVAKRWVARGHEVTLLTSRFRGSRPSEVIDGVRVIRIGNLRHGTYHLRVQRELARLSGYDAIIDEVNTLPMLTPLWQDDLPPTLGLIHQLAEDVWDAEVSRPIAMVGRMIEPRLLRMYRDVTMATVSGSTMADLDRLGLRDVRVVLEGRDDPPPVGHLEKEGTPTFAFVGRLSANKRPDHAIEAFRTIRRHLPDARLWMIGRGVLEEELRAGAPPGVEFLGRLSRDELFGRMAQAHCLLVPSVREGWGLVITESNGVGTPAVGYDAPGIRDAIRPGRTGLLAPAGEPRGLGERAVEMLSDPVRYEEMRAESRRWAGCFSWDATAEILMRLVRERVRPAPITISGGVDLDAGLAAVE
ncbi:MAG: hypothetical protein QOI81_497, partial [Actinomycetota bacterium]|nr:hypothetical protein [Actinomycetota bacterium]